MPSTLNLFCTGCGQKIDGQATCPSCGAENEFLKETPPSVQFRFDEDYLWTDKAVQRALEAEGDLRPAPKRAPGAPSSPAPPRAKPQDAPGAGPEPPVEVSGEFFRALPVSTESDAAPPRPPPEDAGGDATFILDDEPGQEEEAEQTFILGEPDTPVVVGTLVRLSPPGSGTTYEIRPGMTRIGKEDTEIKLADRAVSRKHAAIQCEARAGVYTCVLADLGSSNGTFVGGQKIAGPTELKDQDVLRLGDVEFQYLVKKR
jgi:hypothetical protein